MGFKHGLSYPGITGLKNEGITASELKEKTRDLVIGYDGHPYIHKALFNVIKHDRSRKDRKELATWIWVFEGKGPVPTALRLQIESQLKICFRNCSQVKEARPALYFDGDVPPIKHNEKRNRYNAAKAAYDSIPDLYKRRKDTVAEIARMSQPSGEEESEDAKSTRLAKVETLKIEVGLLEKSEDTAYSNACQYVLWPMVQAALEVCDRERVMRKVCLYEADVQLPYDCRIGVIGGIAAEDSDFMLYGPSYILFGGVNMEKIKADAPRNAGNYKVAWVNTRDLFKKHWPTPHFDWSKFDFAAMRLFALLVQQDYSKIDTFYGVRPKEADEMVVRLLPHIGGDALVLRRELRNELEQCKQKKWYCKKQIPGTKPIKYYPPPDTDEVLDMLCDGLNAFSRHLVVTPDFKVVRFEADAVPVLPLRTPDEDLVGKGIDDEVCKSW